MKTNLTDALQRKFETLCFSCIIFNWISIQSFPEMSNKIVQIWSYHVHFLSNLISMALGLWILTKIKYHAQLLFMELMIKFLCIVSVYVIIVPMVTWYWDCQLILHYCDVIMTGMSSQTTSLKIVYSTIYSGADQRKHQSFVSLTFLWGIHQWLVNSAHKGLVMQKCFHLMTSSWL